MPRVILGSPLFNHATHFREAIESLLNQTFRDFALILVDDCSTDETPDIAREYAALDSRVWYCRNDLRLGLIDNSRRALALARDRHPDAMYFAWVSDHDLWHPRWLQALVDVLDANPHVVLAYPMNRRIGPSGELLKRLPWRFDTFGEASRWTRLRVGVRHMRAGNMVYGLFRIGVLQRAGVYRRVLVPDRLLFAELSLYGQFKQVTQVLWFRRWYGRVFSLARQRASFFPSRRPLYAYVPWWLSHTAIFFWMYTVRGKGVPEVSRAGGFALALLYLGCASAVHARQQMRAANAWVSERLDVQWRRLRLIVASIRRWG